MSGGNPAHIYSDASLRMAVPRQPVDAQANIHESPLMIWAHLRLACLGIMAAAWAPDSQGRLEWGCRTGRVSLE